MSNPLPELLDADVPEESVWLDDAEDAEYEQRRQQVLRKRDWTMLVIAIAVIVLAFLLETQDEKRVGVKGFSQSPLPELCGSRLLFSADCPGCGLTRSIIALAGGDWEGSLRFHRIGWIMALAILLQIPYRSYRLLKPGAQQSEPRWPNWAGSLLIALLLANWLTNLVTGIAAS